MEKLMTLTQIMIVDDGRNRMRTYEIVVGSKESEVRVARRYFGPEG